MAQMEQTAERKAYAAMRTGFNALLLEVEPPIVNDLLQRFEEYVVAAHAPSVAPPPQDQVKHMVDRFLQWKLPENFTPDGGISFKRMFNENTPHPMKHEPVGTNLFDYAQAEEMVRFMIEGFPGSTPAVTEKKCVSCGVETDYCCADCMIDKKQRVYVCGRTECRDKHEQNGCTRIGI